MEAIVIARDGEIQKFKQMIAEMTTSCSELRSDRDDAQSAVEVMKTKLSTAEQLLRSAVDDRQVNYSVSIIGVLAY